MESSVPTIDGLAPCHCFPRYQPFLSWAPTIELLLPTHSIPSDPTSGLPATTRCCPGLPPFVPLVPAMDLLDSNVSFRGSKSCVTWVRAIEFPPTAPPAVRHPTSHSSSMLPPHHMTLAAGRSSQFIQPSLGENEHTFHCRLPSALAGVRVGPSRGGEAPGLRIVCAGRAGRLGMQVGRMYRGPRGW